MLRKGFVVLLCLLVVMSCHKKMNSYHVKPREKKDAEWVAKLKKRFGFNKEKKSKKKVSSKNADNTFGPLRQGKRKRKREEGLWPREMRK